MGSETIRGTKKNLRERGRVERGPSLKEKLMEKENA